MHTDRSYHTGTIASGSVSYITIKLFTAFVAFVFLRTTTNAAMEAKVSRQRKIREGYNRAVKEAGYQPGLL